MMLAGKITDVKEEYVSEEGAKSTYIRWLITEKDGAPHFAMRRFRVEKGGYTPFHKHSHEHEAYVLSGRGVARVGNEEVPLEKDRFVFVPPNVPHQFLNKGEEDLIFLCIIPIK
ncbi:cupin domain-containing protein [candidate division WOR-3 bacterium]|nr:cupin domain-containing protein [candidate division WOR-3 bacterium]